MPFPAPAVLRRRLPAVALGLAAGLLAGLAGCAAGGNPSAAASSPAAASPASSTGTRVPGQLHGRAQAGPSTIVGAHIYLFAASTAGYGSPSLSLLDPTVAGVSTDQLGAFVTTDSQGNFSLSGAYHCSPGQPVYVLAWGGSASGEAFNPALALLTVFGACPDSGDFSGQIQFVNINQVSTVVSVYALAGFLTDSTHVSSGPSANAQQGLANAFATVANLMDISQGAVFSNTPAGNGVIPQAQLNTLANILVPCSNSVASCSALFALTGSNGVAPADTVGALRNIVANPAANVPALFALAGSQPFQPALSVAPADWTVGITFFAENLAGPYFPAIDGAGNLWVPGYANNTLTEFDPFGNLLSGESGFSGGGLAQPFAVAIDPAGNSWVSNYGAISPGAPVLSEFGANGTAITSNGFGCGTACTAVAIDSNSNLWVSGAPQVTVIRPSGVKLSAFSTNGAASGVAVDSQGRGWSIGSGRNLSRLSLPSTITQFAEGVTAAAGNEFNGLAIDATDNVWFTSPKNNALGRFASDGTAVSPAAGYTGGGLNGPSGLAIDGAGRVWIANRDGNSVSVFAAGGTAVSPAAGFQPAGLSNPRGIALGPSGDVWLTNFTGNSVTELLGAATPTATPMTPSNHGQRP